MYCVFYYKLRMYIVLFLIHTIFHIRSLFHCVIGGGGGINPWACLRGNRVHFYGKWREPYFRTR